MIDTVITSKFNIKGISMHPVCELPVEESEKKVRGITTT